MTLAGEEAVDISARIRTRSRLDDHPSAPPAPSPPRSHRRAEEAWRSLSAIPLLDLRVVLEYVRLRNLATLAAKVGLFLERHKDHFSVPAPVLEELRSLRPRAPHYLDRSARGKLVAPWNLIVPTVLLEGEWEAVR